MGREEIFAAAGGLPGSLVLGGPEGRGGVWKLSHKLHGRRGVEVCSKKTYKEELGSGGY